MRLSVPEIRLLIMALPHGLDSEHLTQEERQDVRGLLKRMSEYCDANGTNGISGTNGAAAIDAAGDGSRGGPGVVR